MAPVACARATITVAQQSPRASAFFCHPPRPSRRHLISCVPHPPCSKHIIVHRDLKPANLMLGGIPHDTGTREMAAREGVVKIADFGLSRSLAIMQHRGRGLDNLNSSKTVRCVWPDIAPAFLLGIGCLHAAPGAGVALLYAPESGGMMRASVHCSGACM